MPYYVCKGAKLKCSMGSEQSDLEVLHLEKPVYLCGQYMAGIMDHKPMMNIKPFGQCTVKDGGSMTITVTDATMKTHQAFGGGQASQGMAVATNTANAQSALSVEKVEGAAETYPRQRIAYKVTKYNKVNDGSDVKWAIKVGKDGYVDTKELENMRGKKTIALKMKPEWAGKEIIVMPYLNSPTETVSVRTEVMRGNIRTKLGERHYNAISELFGKTSDSAALFRKFEKELYVKKTNVEIDKIEYNYLKKELNLNIEADREGVDKDGDKIFEPYERTVHEIWHNIDHLVGFMVDSNFNNPFSYTYKDLISNAIKTDIIDKINVDINIGIVNMSEDEIERLYEFTEEEFIAFTDIIDGITKGRLDLSLGHGVEYWECPDTLSPDALLSTEVFANIAAAEVANERALEVIKTNLPRTYDVYLRILNDMPK